MAAAASAQAPGLAPAADFTAVTLAPAALPAPPAPGGETGPVILTTPGGAFVASLLLPGAGQAALGLARWPLYVAMEAGLWWTWADQGGDFAAFRDGYRDLAWDAARVQTAPRQDPAWPYYEAMSQWLRSGAFDAEPTPGVQPEADASTYNGYVWELARGLYLPAGPVDPGGPEYAAALAWYLGRAAGADYLWSWIGREEDLARFRGLIRSADDARRRQTTALGLVLANHLVSAVDALLAARLGASAPDLESELVAEPGGPVLRLRLNVPITL